MTQPPDNPTQPIPAEATREQPATEVPAVDTASPAWASAPHAGDRSASARPAPARPVPAAGSGPVPSPTWVAPAPPAVRTTSWSSRVSGGRGLAVGALVVGLGLGVVAGSAGTWAVTHDDRGSGATADGDGRFDHDREGDFGPPGGRGGMPPGGQVPGGQVPGNGTDDSPGSDANGRSEAT